MLEICFPRLLRESGHVIPTSRLLEKKLGTDSPPNWLFFAKLSKVDAFTLPH